ncbi:hypothetical protein C2G38_2216299 [Gigaspora rosea]|uniref:Uncharacterized protein n=1 Tax=Gigaspora rosea TaxID=44941 RepID=A0A397UHW7_9GLOM|nr:hypothetical protein C2G38_2216299 [Gigaspora rosea]
MPTAEHDLFSEVVKIIDKYHTEAVNNIVKFEMAQCLFLMASRVEPTPEELISEQESSEEASNGFIEDNYNAQKITLQAIIDEVRSKSIQEIWKVSECVAKKSIIIPHIDDPSMMVQRPLSGKSNYANEKIIFIHEKGIANERYDNEEILIQRPSVLVMAPATKKTIQKRNKYSKIWGLAREATLLAVDNDDNEINISEEPEETDDSYSDDEALDNQDIQVSQNIENPHRVIGRGRPSKRRYKSSIETEQKQQGTSSRGSYKCGQCSEVGHNAAYHKPKGKERGK